MILLKDWDPVGIQDVPQAGDEYDRYIPPIAKMVIGKASAPEVSQRLLEIEIQIHGFGWRSRSCTDRCREAAEHCSFYLSGC
jgi:hypothetical protein